MSQDAVRDDAARRLGHVCALAGLVPSVRPEPVRSYSNDTWLLDDPVAGSSVLRIGYLGDVTRLDREVAVAKTLPAAVPYPEVLGHGGGEVDGRRIAWTLTRRLSGRQLSQVLPGLPEPTRRHAAAQLSEVLRALHTWRPPPAVAGIVSARPPMDLADPWSVIGVDVNPLPLARAFALAPHARTLPHVDPGLITAAVAGIEELADLAPVVDESGRHGLVHGDLHLENVWWSGGADGRIAALLDFEWVRFGPPHLELERLCDKADEDALRDRDDVPSLLRWLILDYPELFDVDRLADRVRLYSLTHALRHLIVWPPDRPEPELAQDHPLRRLRRLVTGPWPTPGAWPEVLAAHR